eukprot:31359-Pelagococcus_subviridis.AAC.6
MTWNPAVSAAYVAAVAATPFPSSLPRGQLRSSPPMNPYHRRSRCAAGSVTNTAPADVHD